MKQAQQKLWWLLLIFFFIYKRARAWMVKNRESTNKYRFGKKASPDKLTHTCARLRMRYVYAYNTIHWFSLPQNTMAQHPKTNMRTNKKFTNYIDDRLTEKSAVDTMLMHRTNCEQRVKRTRAEKNEVIKVNETWKQKRNVLIQEPKMHTHTYTTQQTRQQRIEFELNHTCTWKDPKFPSLIHTHTKYEKWNYQIAADRKKCHTACAIEFILPSLVCTHEVRTLSRLTKQFYSSWRWKKKCIQKIHTKLNIKQVARSQGSNAENIENSRAKKHTDSIYVYV